MKDLPKIFILILAIIIFGGIIYFHQPKDNKTFDNKISDAVQIAAGEDENINFPANLTNLEKLEYVMRAEELLRLQHNENGLKFKNNEITEEQWQDYLINYFNPRSKKLGYESSFLKSMNLIITEENLNSSSTKIEDLKPEPKSAELIMEEFKTSVKFEINLDNILK